jgi:DeoR/GlpR family transcriptional regulator of sugar metabolism
MIERAEKVYVLAHADKLGRRPFHAWAPVPPGATPVTDESATDAQTRRFEEAGMHVVRAGARH